MVKRAARTTTDVRRLFIDLQGTLQQRLMAARRTITHAATKGTTTEANWIEFLGEYLPSRYQTSNALVVDHTGATSDQIDIVVHDRQYSPLVFRDHGALLVPAESVYAVFEVKQTCNRQNIEYAAQKAESVRRLVRTSARIAHAGGTFRPRRPFPIIAGLLCTDSEWSPFVGRPLAAALRRLSRDQHLDLGCALGAGAFDCEPSGGTRRISSGKPTTALVWLLFHLTGRLQRLGTVPAIDLRVWSRAID
jgi:hypothetical protein